MTQEQELLVAGTVSAEGFKTLVASYHVLPTTPTLMLQEAQPRLIVAPEERQNLLRFALFSPNFNFALYTAGRIFHQQGELRWEKRAAHVHIVYTGHKAFVPELHDAEVRTLSGYSRVSRNYFLFGKRLDDGQLDRIGPAAQKGDFAEVRIPRLLRYPVLPTLAGAERIQLAVYEYVDGTTGANVAYRFHGLVPFEKPQEQKSR